MEFNLKSKLKNILQKEGIQKVQKAFKPSSSESLFPPVQISPLCRDSETEIRNHPSDPLADEEILNSIDPLFFTTNFDPSLHELQKLPDPLNLTYLQSSRQRLLKELTVVSKKVFQLILEKQSSYSGEIQRIREIEDELEAGIFTCREGRAALAVTKNDFTIKSLGILANYQKRQTDLVLLQSLRTIHTLELSQKRVEELLAESNYPSAFQLLLEIQSAASTYSHFTSISQLSSRLSDTLERAEEELDTALSSIPLHFNQKHYASLVKAYGLLGKRETAVDQLGLHFASAVHNTAFRVLHAFVELTSGGDGGKKPYQDLCSCLSQDIFIPCLVDLCKSMWKIVLNYHKLLTWHKKESDSNESSESRDYVDQKLENGSSRIWQDIQTKIRIFLLSSDFTGIKIDEFLHILSIVHTLRSVGEEFCGSESECLRECIRETSLRYFLTYHQTKLDELCIFIENEGWELCPVRSDFDIHQLQEFEFLKNCTNMVVVPKEDDSVPVNCSFFTKFSQSGSPFEIIKESSEENIYAPSPPSNGIISEDGNENQNNEDNDEEEEEEKNKNSSVIITNTSLSILRLFGRYLNSMHLLKSIAFDVAISMSQLFEYYFYSLFIFFASEKGEVKIESISNAQLRVALSRIKNKLIKSEENGSSSSGWIREPRPPPSLSLTSSSDVYALSKRLIASESAVYLASQLESLKRFLQSHLVAESNWDAVAQLIDQGVIVSGGLRKLIFGGVSSRALDYVGVVVGGMDRVDWEVKELMSMHSTYVDLLLRNLQMFAMRVEAVGAEIKIPEAIEQIIWEQIFMFCCRAFVDGFSNVKKCSNSGRGLMQLDFTQFLSKLEKIAPVKVKGLPDKEYVESYVKAFYMPEGIMEQWMLEHSEYNAKQLTSLITCAFQSNKKSKQKLLALVDEIEKRKS